jgi:Lon protease-like protein
MGEIPLFPLKTVLFPGMLLPIHVFEKRYLDMIAALQAEGHSFGVVLTKEGQEFGEPAVPHRIGTAAHVIRAERADDGSLDIMVVGRDRFAITEIVQERPHLVGVSEKYPLLHIDDPKVTRLVRKVKQELRAYMELLGRASGTVIQVEQLPDEPEILVWVIGIALQISSAERQRLLECPDLPTLYSKELELLSVEQKLLRFIAATQSDRDRWNRSPFINWSPN